jgi:hypothetical protein
LSSAPQAAPLTANQQAIEATARRENLTLPLFISNSRLCGNPKSARKVFDPYAG